MIQQRSSSAATYFSHSQRDQVSKVQHAAGSPDPIQYFSYNGTGERVRAREGATEAYWSHDGSKLVRERLSTGTTAKSYRHNTSRVPGGIVEIVANDLAVPNNRAHPAYNEDGSVVQLATSSDIPESYTYDRFGVTSDSGATTQRARYVSDGLIALATTQDIYLTPGGGCYLPGPGRFTFWPKRRRFAPQQPVPGQERVHQDRDGNWHVPPPPAPDDPRDLPLPVAFGEEIDSNPPCIAGDPILYLYPRVNVATDIDRHLAPGTPATSMIGRSWPKQFLGPIPTSTGIFFNPIRQMPGYFDSGFLFLAEFPFKGPCVYVVDEIRIDFALGPWPGQKTFGNARTGKYEQMESEGTPDPLGPPIPVRAPQLHWGSYDRLGDPNFDRAFLFWDMPGGPTPLGFSFVQFIRQTHRITDVEGVVKAWLDIDWRLELSPPNRPFLRYGHSGGSDPDYRPGPPLDAGQLPSSHRRGD